MVIFDIKTLVHVNRLGCCCWDSISNWKERMNIVYGNNELLIGSYSYGRGQLHETSDLKGIVDN